MALLWLENVRGVSGGVTGDAGRLCNKFYGVAEREFLKQPSISPDSLSV